MHTGESVVLGGLIAEGLKGEVGRARPKISPDDSHIFRTGRGFSSDDYGSFPSAETTAAFAMMSTLTRGINRDWPGHSRWVTPIAYTSATLVAASRLYRNEHWASDVVAASGLGTFTVDSHMCKMRTACEFDLCRKGRKVSSVTKSIFNNGSFSASPQPNDYPG